uniref:Bm525 n=1 Tax=Brugia malayi TaxID=6279 RepID=A0A1I9GDB5_BRUMA|nr:Bm525 [Brugia malayi]
MSATTVPKILANVAVHERKLTKSRTRENSGVERVRSGNAGHR